MYLSTMILGGGAIAMIVLSFFPPIQCTSRKFDKKDGKGFVIDIATRRAQWWSHCGKGKRHFVGNILRGLRKRDRADALRIIRLLKMDRNSMYTYVPLSYYLNECSPAVRARIYAPLKWADASPSSYVTIGTWIDACETWWQP